MSASVEYRQDEMSIKEKEMSDDLSLFIDFDAAKLNLEVTLDSESENPLMSDTRLTINGPDGADDILNSENTSDYDWLLSLPRDTTPSIEMEEQKDVTCHKLISNGQSTSSESRLEDLPVNGTSSAQIASKLPASSNGVKSSNATVRRPSPSRKAPSTGSRSSTPTIRSVAPSISKPSRSSTPTSRATVASIKPVPPSKRSITPTARPNIISAASKSKSRSSTPMSKSASRSSTPTATTRPSNISASKTTSRSSTPTGRPSNPSGLLAPSRGSFPSIKSRPSKNPLETSQTVKKSLPERSASASKERPGPPTVKLNASETNFKTVPKRTSCSPSRGPALSNSVKPAVTRSRGYSDGNDDVNPVLMGTKMVERVVNMRKLAPPKEDQVTDQNVTSGKLSVSQDKGFGRSLSKKSFDMALRHLDIRRSMPGNMRASITKVPASSVYSVRSESIKTVTRSASDSPLATSSSASSDLSENGRSYYQ
ncbi:uncharacterized protein [Rutidosis leptorrhynchoides]|uniref:uncharacterized protein n=1 Tax=Rutidosis leptorrhynchoides TaxID=125765 RepID=UPI003A9915D9